jgi:mono/diheme cytochrome c family protein
MTRTKPMTQTKLLRPGLFWLPVLLALAGTVTVAIAPTIPAPRAGAAEPLDGKAVFMAQKCNLCHGVEAEGIASKATSEKTKGPDLSSVGLERDAAWIEKFLRREEKIDGKVHKKETKATDQELKALASWLASLKKKA